MRLSEIIWNSHLNNIKEIGKNMKTIILLNTEKEKDLDFIEKAKEFALTTYENETIEILFNNRTPIDRALVYTVEKKVEFPIPLTTEYIAETTTTFAIYPELNFKMPEIKLSTQRMTLDENGFCICEPIGDVKDE